MVNFIRFRYLLALFFSAIVWGQQSSDVALAAGIKLLEEGRTTLSEPALQDARDAFLKVAQDQPGNPVYLLDLARAEFYRCNAAEARGDKKAADARLEQAITDVEQALKLDERSAEAHSLLADLYGRKIGLGRGFMLGARFGPKLTAENKRALELDGNNPQVLASAGRQYLQAPKAFGGDVDKAISSLKRSTEIDPQADETFVWLAMAYRKKGDAASANAALDQALKLNPRSVFAQKTKAGK